MSYLSSTQIAVLRNDHPHISKFYLSVIKPVQVYCGTITGSPASGANSFTLTNVSGSIANLVEGMTIYVGTSEGNKSITKRRYRSRVGNVITIDENAIPWANGWYVTAYKNWELWGILPYITDADPPVFYKDRDIVYTDQNSILNPVAIAGGPFVGFLDGGSITFSLVGTHSYPIAPLVSISSWVWACDGGTIVSSTSATTSITFITAGQYWLTLTVGDENGKYQTIHTPIFVHERSGANVPITDFAISSDLTGDFQAGGYDMGIEMWDKSVIDDIVSGAYCVLWKESTYDGVAHYYGNNANIQFAGYIRGESINRNVKVGMVVFTLCTIHGILDKIQMPSISLEESADTPTWYRFPARTLTVTRAVHHLWRWHSTLFSIADVYLPYLQTDTMAACDDFENGSLYSMVDNFTYQYSIFAKVCCDCAGRVYVEQDVNLLDSIHRHNLVTMMAIEDTDRRAESDVNFTRNVDKTACVAISGISYNGSAYIPILSVCPGNLYSDIGIDVAVFERLVLHDQDYANFLSGRLFSITNQDVKEISMALAGDYPIDIVPQVWWQLNDMDTKRSDINIESIKAICRHITYRIDLVSGTTYPEVTFEPEALNILGYGVTDAIGIPVTPPVDPTPTIDPGTIPDINPIVITTVGRFGWSFAINVVATGIVGMIEVPYNCVIDSAKLVAKPGESGSIVIDIWKCSYANIATGTHPVNGDSITGANPPTLTSAYKSLASLSGWTIALVKGDWLFFNVDSFTTIDLVTLSMSGLVHQ